MKSQRIAIAFDSIDQLEHCPLDLDAVIQPETNVILLIRSNASQRICTRALLNALERYSPAARETCKREWCDDGGLEGARAEQALAPLRQALATKGTALQIHMHAAPLREALDDLMQLRRVPLLVLHVRKQSLLVKIFHAGLATLGLRRSAPVSRASIDLCYSALAS